jgi:hypothetical protein
MPVSELPSSGMIAAAASEAIYALAKQWFLILSHSPVEQTVPESSSWSCRF